MVRKYYMGKYLDEVSVFEVEILNDDCAHFILWDLGNYMPPYASCVEDGKIGHITNVNFFYGDEKDKNLNNLKRAIANLAVVEDITTYNKIKRRFKILDIASKIEEYGLKETVLELADTEGDEYFVECISYIDDIISHTFIPFTDEIEDKSYEKYCDNIENYIDIMRKENMKSYEDLFVWHKCKRIQKIIDNFSDRNIEIPRDFLEWVSNTIRQYAFDEYGSLLDAKIIELAK